MARPEATGSCAGWASSADVDLANACCPAPPEYDLATMSHASTRQRRAGGKDDHQRGDQIRLAPIQPAQDQVLTGPMSAMYATSSTNSC
jgi:hypothetical protein